MPNHPYIDDDKRLLELLDRWQSGDFTRADEQEMQALTGSDEFRREAAEGYWNAPEEDHGARLVSLQKRLQQRQGGAMRVSYFRVLAAAAALLVLVLAVVWLIPQQPTLQPVAKTELPADQEQSVVAQPSETAAAAETKRSAPASEPAARLEQSIQKELEKSTDQKDVAMNTSVASEAAAPQASAPEALRAAKPSTPVEKARQRDYADLETEDDVDMSPGNMAPSQKKSDAYGKAKKAPGKQKPDSISTARPVTDWADFQNYLRRNARLTEAARQHNVSGMVQVRFVVDSDNQPVRFQILRSLGYGCDEEAIRLIKNYSWQSGDQQTLTVEVPFVR